MTYNNTWFNFSKIQGAGGSLAPKKYKTTSVSSIDTKTLPVIPEYTPIIEQKMSTPLKNLSSEQGTTDSNRYALHNTDVIPKYITNNPDLQKEIELNKQRQQYNWTQQQITNKSKIPQGGMISQDYTPEMIASTFILPGLLKPTQNIFGKLLGEEVGNVVGTGVDMVNPLSGMKNTKNTLIPHYKNPNNDFKWVIGNETTRPYNKISGNSVQDEYIANLKRYYDSPEFKRIMNEHNPDVDIEMYKQKTLENLEHPIVYNEDLAKNFDASGVYYPKQSFDGAIMPGANPSLKIKLKYANTADNKGLREVGHSGKSYVQSLYATEHELGHQRTNSEELLPNYITQEELLNPKNINRYLTAKDLYNDLSKTYNLSNYYSNPTEFEVRIRGLKEDIKNANINDYFMNKTKSDHIYTLMNEKRKPWYVHPDSYDLTHYWSREFLAEMANKIPSLYPIGLGTIIGASQNKK